MAAKCGNTEQASGCFERALEEAMAECKAGEDAEAEANKAALEKLALYKEKSAFFFWQ